VSSGKTHLAHIWVRRIQQMLPRPIQIPILPAHSVNMKNLNKLVNDYPYLVIDNFDACVNEEAFFHLYNFYNVPERALLFISERPLAKLGIKLPDLRSRLSTIPQAEIFPPDDEMLTALVAKLFNDCQIVISQEILEYILFHVERSFSYISRLVAEIDDISWTLGRAVTIPMVRTAIRNIERGQQLELFV
jgi:chromosomal replication initiation ATPase DnaA